MLKRHANFFCMQMAHSHASHGHNSHKDAKDARLERHSAGARGSQAYGDTGNKHGAGKFNWGEFRKYCCGSTLNTKQRCVTRERRGYLCVHFYVTGNMEHEDTANALNDPKDPFYDSDLQDKEECDGRAGKAKKC